MKPLIESFSGRSLFRIILAGLLVCLSVPAKASPEAQKSVLILYATRKDAPGTGILERVFQKTLSDGLAGRLDYYGEYIDVARFPEPGYQAALRDFLRRKYERLRFDLIIAASNTGFEFMKRYGAELFPGVPVVFSGGRELRPIPNSTGLVYTIDMKGTLDQALRLQPEIKRVVVVSGVSDSDKYYENIARRQFREYEGRLAFTYLTGLPLEELQETAAKLPEDSIVYFLTQTEDVVGNRYIATDVLDKVSLVANAPIYSWAELALDHGIIGGSLLSSEMVARQTAELALRALRGEKPEQIPITEIRPNLNIFDWRQLRRWGISEARLPHDGVVRFKKPTLWEEYRWSVISFITFCFAQTLLIARLFAQRSRRRRAERALAEKELRLRESQAIAHVGSFHWDVAANAVAWSDELCRIYGLEPGDPNITYETYLQQAHPDHQEQVRRAVERARTMREPFEHEYRIVRPTGETRWVFAHGRPVVDAGGNLIALQGICQDITERKQTRESLRESEMKNQAMLEAVPDLMFLQSRDGVYLDFHAQDPSVLLVPPEQFLGKNMRDVLPPELTERFAKSFEDVAQSGQIGLLEYSLPLLGEERHYEARVVNCDHDKVLSLVRDITEHKQIEQALRVSEEQARRTLVEQMLVGVAECDTAGKFTLVNQRFCEITGYTEAELLGMRMRDITIQDDLLRTAELYRRLVEAGESFIVEKRYLRKDGSEVWVNANVSPVRNAQGEVVESVSVVIDISDRKRAEREREQLLKEAQAANRSKDEFLAVVSHELRSPLNAILGYTRFLRKGTVDAAEVRKTVEIIERNGKMQLQLIEDLLDSARIISGKLKLELEPVSLSGVITAALDVVAPTAKAKGIELVSNLEPLAGPITGDPNRLQQVVWNLLSNAIKFTPDGGRVELRMENMDRQVRITVRDTGKGIEPEFLPFVFDRFRQSDSSSVRRFGGLGLGLSLVKQLVESHGGTIVATSGGPGRGATFTVTLPQRAAQTEAFIPEQPSAVAAREARMEVASPFDQIPSLAGVRVLVVDDEEEARSLLTAVLGESGAQVMAVSSGVEALAILADPPGGNRQDALILDINMPDEDGYQALERVRELEAERGVAPSARIPAIALTAMGRTEDRLKALTAGFQMHVVKPVEPGELIMVIASLIERLSVGRSV
jgi:hypothetical protein